MKIRPVNVLKSLLLVAAIFLMANFLLVSKILPQIGTQKQQQPTVNSTATVHNAVFHFSPGLASKTTASNLHSNNGSSQEQHRQQSMVSLSSIASNNLHNGKTDHKLCIVVPFHDRFEELLRFVPHISQFVRNQSSLLQFEIAVINQVDQYRFNRGSLINVGYFEAKRLNCDYFAMHDVDLLPLNVALNYGYPASGPYHVAAPQYHPRYNYASFLGGILIVTLQHFSHVNGLSNKYWGWGLEDDEFNLRLRDANISVIRPENLSTNRSTTFVHFHDSRKRKRDMTKLYNQKKESRKRDRRTGLSTLIFDIVARFNITISGWNCQIVNVELTCNHRDTPWCEKPSQ